MARRRHGQPVSGNGSDTDTDVHELDTVIIKMEGDQVARRPGRGGYHVPQTPPPQDSPGVARPRRPRAETPPRSQVLLRGPAAPDLLEDDDDEGEETILRPLSRSEDDSMMMGHSDFAMEEIPDMPGRRMRRHPSPEEDDDNSATRVHRMAEVMPRRAPVRAGGYPEPEEYPRYREPDALPAGMEPIPPCREAILDPAQVNPLVTPLRDPDSVATGQYRWLQFKVEEILRQRNFRAMAITSANAGEGKTVTAVNLAFVLAESPKRTVALVDLNFRTPAVAGLLGLPPHPGMLQVVLGEQGINDVVMRVRGKNLWLINAGGAHPNPPGLLTSQALDHALHTLKRRYDILVVDTPAIFPKADITQIAAHMDGLLLVVKARKTRRDTLSNALKMINKESILGLIINEVDRIKTPK